MHKGPNKFSNLFIKDKSEYNAQHLFPNLSCLKKMFVIFKKRFKNFSRKGNMKIWPYLKVCKVLFFFKFADLFLFQS